MKIENSDSCGHSDSSDILELKIVSGPVPLALNALDGRATIIRAEKTFAAYISPGFNKDGLNQSQAATPTTKVGVYVMQGKGDFNQIFSGLHKGIDTLALTQSQIICFCEKYPQFLAQDACENFFLINLAPNYFVARVGVFITGLYIFPYLFTDNRIWYSELRTRVIVRKFGSH